MICAFCNAPYPCVWDVREMAWQDFDGYCYFHDTTGCGSDEYCAWDVEP